MKPIFPHTMSRRIVLNPATDDDQDLFFRTLLRAGIESFRPANASAGALSDRCNAAYIVASRRTGKAIGFATLHALDPAGHMRCGIYLDPRDARLGVGAEALNLLINYAFAAFNIDRLITQTTEVSFNSFGLSIEDKRITGCLREHLYFRGKLWDLHNGQIRRRTWNRYIDGGLSGVLPPGQSWREPPYTRPSAEHTSAK